VTRTHPPPPFPHNGNMRVCPSLSGTIEFDPPSWRTPRTTCSPRGHNLDRHFVLDPNILKGHNQDRHFVVHVLEHSDKTKSPTKKLHLQHREDSETTRSTPTSGTITSTTKQTSLSRNTNKQEGRGQRWSAEEKWSAEILSLSRRGTSPNPR
jgi:hypothetical protein